VPGIWRSSIWPIRWRPPLAATGRGRRAAGPGAALATGAAGGAGRPAGQPGRAQCLGLERASSLAGAAAGNPQALTGTFAKVQVVVDPPLQMARELAALQRASGQASGRDLEAMLAAYAALAPAQAAPEAIDDSAGELRLKGVSADSE